VDRPHQRSGRGGEETDTLRPEGVQKLEPLKSFLWHDNIYCTLPIVQVVEMDLDAAVPNTGYNTARTLPNTAEGFHPCIEQNKRFIPNYGERDRCCKRGLRYSITSWVVWSAVGIPIPQLRRTKTRQRSPQICVLPFCQ
jgi:hypothetical protein